MYKDKEKRRECQARWRAKHREYLREYYKQYRQKHRTRDSEFHSKPHYCITCGVYLGDKPLSYRKRHSLCRSCGSKTGAQNRLREPRFCIDCGKVISPKSKRCSRCHNKQNIYIRTPEVRERNRQGLLRHLENPKNLATFTRNIALATVAPRSHTKPNKAELKLTELLNHLYPNEWHFTGNGDFWIGNLNPDFVSTNGEKLIIELFGDYWHNRDGLPYHQSELGRIMYFNGYGYKTLVIWENELKNTLTVAKKINHWLKKQRTSPNAESSYVKEG